MPPNILRHFTLYTRVDSIIHATKVLTRYREDFSLSENTPCGPEPVCRDKDIVSTLTYTQERPSAALLRGPVSSTTVFTPLAPWCVLSQGAYPRYWPTWAPCSTNGLSIIPTHWMYPYRCLLFPSPQHTYPSRHTDHRDKFLCQCRVSPFRRRHRRAENPLLTVTCRRMARKTCF